MRRQAGGQLEPHVAVPRQLEPTGVRRFHGTPRGVVEGSQAQNQVLERGSPGLSWHCCTSSPASLLLWAHSSPGFRCPQRTCPTWLSVTLAHPRFTYSHQSPPITCW